jgi:integrase
MTTQVLTEPETRYSREGKIETPLSDDDFAKGMNTGLFLKQKHKGLCVLLHYSAVRISEALKAKREQFTVTKEAVLFNVGPRLKKTKRLKICSGCEERNSRKAHYCRRCGKDISQLETTLVGTKSITTHALKLPLSAPYMDLLKEAIEETQKEEEVFDYCRKTGYNITTRAFKYPHLFRLSRITNFLLEGWTLVDVRSWTGLSLAALEYYTGLVKIDKMGDSLANHSKTSR